MKVRKQNTHISIAIKALTVCVLLVLLVVACKKNDSIDARPKPQCLINVSIASDKTQQFIYDDQYRIQEIITVYTNTGIKPDTTWFLYGADKRLAKTYYFSYNTGNRVELIDTLIYDDARGLITIDTYYPPDTGKLYHLGSSRVVEKNSNNYVQKIRQYYVSGSSLVYDGMRVYERDNKGNITKMTLFNANTDSLSSLNSTFDNKINPFANLAYTFLYDLLESPNNPVSSSVRYPSVAQAFTRTYEMKYSRMDMPDTIITHAGVNISITALHHLCH